MSRTNRRSYIVGLAASAGFALVYAAIVGGLSGSSAHLENLFLQDWYLVIPIVGGFGIQVGLMSELRHRRRLEAASATAGAAGTGASAVGMVACCVHHAADLAPLIGIAGVATFLTDFRLPIMLVGLAITAVGIALVARQLLSPRPGKDQSACAPA